MPLQDLQNADCVWIQGSNMAEAHPVGFRWVMKAKERGAKVFHVDPRFGRTSAMADFHVPIPSAILAIRDGRVALTDRGVLLSDTIFAELV